MTTTTQSDANDYFKDIAQVLSQYRINGFLCDTVLLTNNGQLRAHSALLAAASPFFKAAMEADLSHNIHYMHVTELDTETVEVALTLMYTGRLVVPVAYSSTDQISVLLGALKKLGLERSALANSQIDISRHANTELTSELLCDFLAENHLKKDDCKPYCTTVVEVQLNGQVEDEVEVSLPKPTKGLVARRKRKAIVSEKVCQTDSVPVNQEPKLHRQMHKEQNISPRVRGTRKEHVAHFAPLLKEQGSNNEELTDLQSDEIQPLLAIKREMEKFVDDDTTCNNDALVSGYQHVSSAQISSYESGCSNLCSNGLSLKPDIRCLRSKRTKSHDVRRPNKLRQTRDITLRHLKEKLPEQENKRTKPVVGAYRKNYGRLKSDININESDDTTIVCNPESKLFESVTSISPDSRETVREQSSLMMSHAAIIKDEDVREGDVSDDKAYSCHVCGFTSKYRSNMTKHVRRHEGPMIVVRKYKCQLCSKAFGKNSHLIKHVRTHTGERPHKCLVCERTFSERANMERHALMHSVIKPHLCELCGKGFIRKNFLADHVAVHHATKQTAQDCAQCGLTFTRRLSLVRHCLKVHGSHNAGLSGRVDEVCSELGLGGGAGLQDVSEQQPMICDVCGKSFITLTTLKNHARIHANHAALTCNTCARTYSSLTNLRLHERSVHSANKPHACTVCDKTFALKTQLNLHMVRHSGVKNYQCHVCLKGFVLHSSLQSHVKIHSTEKKFCCQVCNKSFKFQNTLTAHIRTHTGEKPYKCTHCAMAFKQNVHLTRHIRSHTGEKPYACELCARAYKNKIDLGYHYTRFHQVNRT